MKHSLLLRMVIGVGWFLLVILLVALFLTVLPLLALLGLYFLLVEVVFSARLWWAGRSLSWAEARTRLRTGGGTLVLEVLPNGGAVERVWLLNAPLPKLDPHAPWPEFADLGRQLQTQPGALTVGERLTTWHDRYLPRLAPSMSLVSFASGSARQCVDAARLPEGSVAYAFAPQLTDAVRRSFGRPRK
jgi:hypothetical protein